MPIKFSTSTMLNPTAVEEVASKASSKLVKGERTLADSSLGKMARGYKNLYNKGITNNLNSNISNNDFATELFSALGCSVSTEPKEFTLLSEQTDAQEIENENILDLSSFEKTMSGENILATDKFSNDSSDPFYTLDDAPATTLQKQSKQASQIITPDLQDITAAIVDINLSNSGTTLKQFK